MNIYIYDDLVSVRPKLFSPIFVSRDFYRTTPIKLKNLYKEFFINVMDEVQVDPISFKNDLAQDKIRPSHWGERDFL
jgi:hypothetical protein